MMAKSFFPASILVALFVTAQAVCAVAQGAENIDGAPVAPTRGLNHVGLTVRDLDASVAFFTEGLSWETAGGDPDYPSVFVTDGAI